MKNKVLFTIAVFVLSASALTLLLYFFSEDNDWKGSLFIGFITGALCIPMVMKLRKGKGDKGDA